jgi:hypothetical protein
LPSCALQSIKIDNYFSKIPLYPPGIMGEQNLNDKRYFKKWNVYGHFVFENAS